MVKEFYGYVEVHSFLVRLKNYKIRFLCDSDYLSAISQFHILVSFLLTVTSSERRFLSAGVENQQIGRN